MSLQIHLILSQQKCYILNINVWKFRWQNNFVDSLMLKQVRQEENCFKIIRNSTI